MWIGENASSIRGYRGAFLAGSLCWLDDTDAVSAFSDIDIHVFVDDDQVDAKPRKFRYHGALLEVSIDPVSMLDDPESTLASAPVAASIARNRILDDPGGLLRPAFAFIAAEYPKRHRVIARMDAIQARIVAAMGQDDEREAFHDQVMRWIFPAGVTTHLLLAAGLGNPTVRRRFVEVKHLLDRYNEPGMLDTLLDLVASAHVTREMAGRHLAALTPIYDAMSAIEETTSRWLSDVGTDSRSISIDGTRDLIDRGFHRESMFWIVATFTRCLSVNAGSDETDSFAQADEAFRALMSDLGIVTTADIGRKKAAVAAALPGIRETADRILERNPDVIRD
jgi:hypothetical protein